MRIANVQFWLSWSIEKKMNADLKIANGAGHIWLDILMRRGRMVLWRKFKSLDAYQRVTKMRVRQKVWNKGRINIMKYLSIYLWTTPEI